MGLSDEANACRELDEYFNHLSSTVNVSNKVDLSRPVKNAVELKRTLISNFCKEHLVSRC